MHAKLSLVIKGIQVVYVVAWVGFGIYMLANHAFPITHSETAAAIFVAITVLSAPLGVAIFIPGTGLIGATLNTLTSNLNFQVTIILVLGFVVGAIQWFFLVPWLIKKKWPGTRAPLSR